jgi:hypothetical protein
MCCQDDHTDYPLNFQLWQPADLEKLEQGLPAANIRLRASSPSKKAIPRNGGSTCSTYGDDTKSTQA